MTKTGSAAAAAVALVKQGYTLYAAAKEAGVAWSTVRRALDREKNAEHCPACGQVLPPKEPEITPSDAKARIAALTKK